LPSSVKARVDKPPVAARCADEASRPISRNDTVSEATMSPARPGRFKRYYRPDLSKSCSLAQIKRLPNVDS
jgi:hypothetical protein